MHQPTRIEIGGTFNFRDIGGWDTPAGRVAQHKVFRSDGLSALTDDARARLQELGIATVIDLREERERTNAPNALGDLPVNHIHAPLFGNRLYPADRDRPDRIVLEKRDLETLYGVLLDRFALNVAHVIDLVANADGPLVYHCSAGKDRTGVVTAFIHELIGVARDDVVTDYNATEQFLGAEFLAAISANFANAGIVANLSETATQAPRVYMDNMLRRVDDEFGGVEQFLLSGGMNTKTPDLLRQKLLVD